jgi:STE24 endopeptidase
MMTSMDLFLCVLVGVLLVRVVLLAVAKRLNMGHCATELPAPFEGWYDAERYAASQAYLRESTQLSLLELLVGACVMVVLLTSGVLGMLDGALRAFLPGELWRGVLFLAILGVGGYLLGLPFTLADTFGIEARYGFNRTQWKTFVADQLRMGLLALVLGVPLLLLVLWLFGRLGGMGWLWCWGVVSLFQVVMVLIAPYLIMPLFNRYEPLPEGELRSRIMAYMEAQGLPLEGVYVMDGSRRSARGNAFFTGFGRSRRIVLFDTLIANHPVEELVAVLAHEVGHYRLKHIPVRLLRGVLYVGVMFAGLGVFLRYPVWSEACGLTHSVYAGLFLFGVLFEPLSLVLGMVENGWSRRDEFAADAFALRTSGGGAALADGLKRLSVDNLGNLTPHPLTVLLSYSHPPVLERLKRL